MLKDHSDYIFTNGYGDWCAPNNNTWKGFFNDVEVVNTALFCMIMRQLADSAAELGKPDAAEYRVKYEEAKAAFHKRFFNPETNTYGDGSQVNEVLPLAFDIVPAEKRDDVAKALIDRIRNVDKGHIDTGIFGTRYIGDVLCDLGEVDLLIDMHSQKNYPGFGYMFEQGATTLWEPVGVPRHHAFTQPRYDVRRRVLALYSFGWSQTGKAWLPGNTRQAVFPEGGRQRQP